MCYHQYTPNMYCTVQKGQVYQIFRRTPRLSLVSNARDNSQVGGHARSSKLIKNHPSSGFGSSVRYHSPLKALIIQVLNLSYTM